MEMRQYLIDTFLFNDQANKKQLDKIKQLPEPSEAIRFFSHLINSQNKWLKRLIVYPEDPKMDWWEPMYELDKLEAEWDKSLKAWIEFLSDHPDEKLEQERRFVGYDGATWTAPLKAVLPEGKRFVVYVQKDTIIRIPNETKVPRIDH